MIRLYPSLRKAITGDRVVPLGEKQTRFLEALALRAHPTISSGELIEAVWHEPATQWDLYNLTRVLKQKLETNFYLVSCGRYRLTVPIVIGE